MTFVTFNMYFIDWIKIIIIITIIISIISVYLLLGYNTNK